MKISDVKKICYAVLFVGAFIISNNVSFNLFLMINLVFMYLASFLLGVICEKEINEGEK